MFIDKQPGYVADEMEKKLILLFVFEKMEFPLTDQSISEIIMQNSRWLGYMEFKNSLYLLTESKFVVRSRHGAEMLYTLTQSGRGCIEHFYQKIPASIREDITSFAAENRPRFKRKQEFTYNYVKNRDGTWLVTLWIREHLTENLLEINLKVPTKAEAVRMTQSWRDKAAFVYESIVNSLE